MRHTPTIGKKQTEIIVRRDNDVSGQRISMARQKLRPKQGCIEQASR